MTCPTLKQVTAETKRAEASQARLAKAFNAYWDEVEDPYASPKARLMAYFAFRAGYRARNG